MSGRLPLRLVMVLLLHLDIMSGSSGVTVRWPAIVKFDSDMMSNRRGVRLINGSRNMHSHEIDNGRHNHDFLGANHGRNARRVSIAIGLSFFVMIAEIVAGQVLGSMALLADGLHMATHVGAFAIAAAAY